MASRRRRALLRRNGPAILSVVIAPLFGLGGVLLGVHLTGEYQSALARQERAAKAVAEMLSPTLGPYPPELLEAVGLFKVMGFAVFADGATLRQLAALRDFAVRAGVADGCWNRLDEPCRELLSRQVVILRKAAGSDDVTPAEVRAVLELNFRRFEQSLKRLQGK